MHYWKYTFNNNIIESVLSILVIIESVLLITLSIESVLSMVLSIQYNTHTYIRLNKFVLPLIPPNPGPLAGQVYLDSVVPSLVPGEGCPHDQKFGSSRSLLHANSIQSVITSNISKMMIIVYHSFQTACISYWIQLM